jgi:N-acetylmuramoyl-L-alanine amidase
MRNINSVILHCSATREGQYVDVGMIRAWHLGKGWSDVGYHYVILLDGTIQSGRPLSKPGAHTRGKNKHSIGICYIGGCDAEGKPKDTMTYEQERSFKKLCRALVMVLDEPLSLHAHNEFSKKACPSFAIADKFVALSAWMESGWQGC